MTNRLTCRYTVGWIKRFTCIQPSIMSTGRKSILACNYRGGCLGENLTTEGMLEDEVSIGDQFRVGSVELMVTQPRLPCYKLGIRFGREDIIKRFMAAGRPGFYLRVLQEGEVGAGDTIERISRDDGEVTVSDVFRLIGKDRDDTETLRRAVQVKTLPDSLRSHFLNNLERQVK